MYAERSGAHREQARDAYDRILNGIDAEKKLLNPDPPEVQAFKKQMALLMDEVDKSNMPSHLLVELFDFTRKRSKGDNVEPYARPRIAGRATKSDVLLEKTFHEIAADTRFSISLDHAHDNAPVFLETNFLETTTIPRADAVLSNGSRRLQDRLSEAEEKTDIESSDTTTPKVDPNELEREQKSSCH